MFTPSTDAPTLRVGIFRASSIGDVVLATSCMNLLNKLHMPIQVYWIGKQPSLQLIANAFPKVICLEIDDQIQISSFVPKLASLHFFVDLQTNLRSWYLGHSLKKEYGIPVFLCKKKSVKRGSMTFKARLRGRKKTLPEALTQCNQRQHQLMSQCLNRALEYHLPVETRDPIGQYSPIPELPIKAETQVKPWLKELKFGAWLAIAPGAAYEAKRAPEDVLVDILRRIHAQLVEEKKDHCGIVFLGSEQDRPFTLKLIDRLEWSYPILNLTGKLSLWEAATALQEVGCILSNDSALCHIAEAVGTHAVVLFGPTVENFGFAPWRSKSRSYSVPLGCRPCSKHGDLKCRYQDSLCFRMLPTHEIAAYTCKLLSQ